MKSLAKMFLKIIILLTYLPYRSPCHWGFLGSLYDILDSIYNEAIVFVFPSFICTPATSWLVINIFVNKRFLEELLLRLGEFPETLDSFRRLNAIPVFVYFHPLHLTRCYLLTFSPNWYYFLEMGLLLVIYKFRRTANMP